MNRPWDLERAFEAAMLGQVDALVPVDDYLTVTDRSRIVDFAGMSRLPAIYGLREFVDAGGLIAYGTDRVICFSAPPPTSIGSCEAPDRPTFPWKLPASSSW